MKQENEGWTLLSTHGHVLVCLARSPGLTLAELAMEVGISERHAHSVVHALSEAGYVSVSRVGRRNRYEIDGSRPFRHQSIAEHQVGLLLDALA